jgi:hypothetical protein
LLRISTKPVYLRKSGFVHPYVAFHLFPWPFLSDRPTQHRSKWCESNNASERRHQIDNGTRPFSWLT